MKWFIPQMNFTANFYFILGIDDSLFFFFFDFVISAKDFVQAQGTMFPEFS